MKKLIAMLLALVMLCCMIPAMAEGTIDTSEHVKIVYLVTGDKPTNRTDDNRTRNKYLRTYISASSTEQRSVL